MKNLDTVDPKRYSYDYICRVIRSCVNYVQLINCRNLINNFDKLYNDKYCYDTLMSTYNYKYINLEEI